MPSQPQQTIQLGKYELLEKIGEGGFGVVYRGRDTYLDRMVAIKVLKGDATSAPDFVERFRREARLAASLRHPAIINVLDVGEQDGRFFIVMDLLTGGTLNDLLKDGKPLPLNQAIELLRPIASALDYAHSKNMLHRDVKPSNILRDEHGQPVLTDFGLGKALDSDNNSTTGIAMGTVQYMAPEQILGKLASPSTDIYALGVVAYQMLTGQVPFSGNTPFTIQKGHAEQKPPDPTSINPALGLGVVGVLMKALEKEQTARYQSGATLLDALAEAAKKEETQYLDAIYRQASELMAQGKYAEAIEKWETLRATQSNFRDVATQEALARQKMDLARQYSELVESLEKLKSIGRTILAVDGDFPDDKAIFSQLGLRQAPVVQAVSPKNAPQKNEAKKKELDKPGETEEEAVRRQLGIIYQDQGDIEDPAEKIEEVVVPEDENPAMIEWMLIPAGKFLFGDENVVRNIDEPYLIGKYPITNAQYKLFLENNPSVRMVPDNWDNNGNYPPEKANHPVVCLSRDDAQAFCQWADCRLPTEVEWEKAARGVYGRKYPWGDAWQNNKYCNSEESKIGDTTPVDQFPKGISPFGVMDMCGNTWEWTDSAHKRFLMEDLFILRGGSWANDRRAATCSSRAEDKSSYFDNDVSFRVVRDLP